MNELVEVSGVTKEERSEDKPKRSLLRLSVAVSILGNQSKAAESLTDSVLDAGQSAR